MVSRDRKDFQRKALLILTDDQILQMFEEVILLNPLGLSGIEVKATSKGVVEGDPAVSVALTSFVQLACVNWPRNFDNFPIHFTNFLIRCHDVKGSLASLAPNGVTNSIVCLLANCTISSNVAVGRDETDDILVDLREVMGQRRSDVTQLVWWMKR